MKTLVVDIETSPALADVWRLWDENVSLAQLREASEVIAVGMKWTDQREVAFYSTFHDGKMQMLDAVHDALSAADAVIHYNGSTFDIPHLNREFLLGVYNPPAPFVEIDLLRTVKKRFRFMSNKLDHVCDQLGLGRKIKHEGHELWVKCLSGDPAAWERMRKYNIRDVVLTDKLYRKMLPWVVGHPSVPLHDDIPGDACPKCGSQKLQKRGYAMTAVGKFQRFQCQGCGAWSKATRREAGVSIRDAA